MHSDGLFLLATASERIRLVLINVNCNTAYHRNIIDVAVAQYRAEV